MNNGFAKELAERERQKNEEDLDNQFRSILSQALDKFKEENANRDYQGPKYVEVPNKDFSEVSRKFN